MTHSPVEAHLSRGNRALMFALLIGCAIASVACEDGGDSDSSATDGGGGGSDGEDGGDHAPGPTGSIDEAALAKCPQSSTLIQTTEWMSCLEGKRLTGVEPFTDLPCELRIGENGTFEYLRDGAVAIAVPDRSTWLNASGNYQNEAISGPRFFLAGIAPDLPAVEGEPRITNVDVSLFAVDSLDDKVEVRYLDAALARQTYNCSVEAL